MDPLIVTLALDARATAFFEAERRACFPPERNLIPAHLTLFHQLPGEDEAAVRDALAEEAGQRAPLALSCTGLRSLGRGVAYKIEGSGLASLRDVLARRFEPRLSAQDRQRTPAHVTVQNKVPPPEARALLARLEAGFVPFPVTGEGLLLWRYRGGPWDPADRFPFAGRN